MWDVLQQGYMRVGPGTTSLRSAALHHVVAFQRADGDVADVAHFELAAEVPPAPSDAG